MINELSFRYFKRYNSLDIKTEMWCHPDQGSFSVFFEKEHYGVFIPYATLRVKKLHNGKRY